MAVKSYVDLAYFVCVMHADPDAVSPSLREAFETESDVTLQHLMYEHARSLLDPNTHLHECIHLWQGLNLPFVYWSSFRAFQAVLKSFHVFNKMFPELHDWQGPTPGILRLLSETVHPYVHNWSIELHMRDKGEMAGYERLAPFSPLALLETAASVIQWRLSRSPAPSPALGFSRWTKREGGYRRMVDYLAGLVKDEELALDMYLPLCNAAFHTLNPVGAFVTGAYQYVAKHKPYLRASPSVYRNRIARLFREINEHPSNAERFREPRQLSELEVSLVDLAQIKLEMRDVLDLRFGESEWRHPTLYTLARRWIDDSRTCPEMRILLNDPGDISDAVVERILEAYQPMMLVRYASPTRVRVVPVLRQGDYDYVTRAERTPNVDGPTALRDLYTMFGLVRRAVGIYYDESTRLCSHQNCPEYNHNYCNTWIFVPKQHQDCSFRENIRFIRETSRRLEEQQHVPRNYPN